MSNEKIGDLASMVANFDTVLSSGDRAAALSVLREFKEKIENQTLPKEAAQNTDVRRKIGALARIVLLDRDAGVRLLLNRA